MQTTRVHYAAHGRGRRSTTAQEPTTASPRPLRALSAPLVLQLLPPLLAVVVLLRLATLNLATLGLVRTAATSHLGAPFSLRLYLVLVLITVARVLNVRVNAVVVLALLALGAPADVDVDGRRGGETERLGDLGEVELRDVEDGLERVGGVRLDVGAEAVASALRQVVVLGDELLEL